MSLIVLIQVVQHHPVLNVIVVLYWNCSKVILTPYPNTWMCILTTFYMADSLEGMHTLVVIQNG